MVNTLHNVYLQNLPRVLENFATQNGMESSHIYNLWLFVLTLSAFSVICKIINMLQFV